MLPDEAGCDRLEADLGALQDAMDGVHGHLYRAGIVRMLAAQTENEAVREQHLRRLRELGEVGWVPVLEALEAECRRLAKVAKDELEKTA